MAQGLKASEIASRYARALYELADKADSLQAVSEDLARLEQVRAVTPELDRALRSPLISRAEHRALAETLATSLRLSLVTARFVALLATRRRMALLPQILAAFAARVAEARGEVTATVTLSAQALKKDRDAIAKQLAGALGKKVNVEVTVDPEILGGAVVRVGARLIDASVRGQIERLRVQLKKAA